ncbi:MAG: TenA family protein [Bryobacterales bacterium]|nr:TenA family protein [Bryobacterales bacterium]
MLHHTLWAASSDLARSCLHHPFVRGLAGGTLDPGLFRRYIAQDAFFLRAFIRAYAVALARSTDPETQAVFHSLIGGALEELELHRRYSTELGIDLEHVLPTPACRAYTDFLLRTAWHSSAAETVASMAPCMRLYAYLGRELAGHSHPGHPYRRWIDTYSDAGFEALAVRLESLLDKIGADSREVRDRYRYAMQCELDFFSQFPDPRSLNDG